MKKLRQALDDATGAQFQDVLRLWSLDGDANAGEARPSPGQSFTVGSYTADSNDYILLSKVQEAIAVRFVWEGLSENERLLLHKMVSSAGRSGVPFETMLKRTAWTEDQLERVAERLEYYLLI